MDETKLVVRVRAGDRVRFTAKAASQGYTQLSAWLRWLMQREVGDGVAAGNDGVVDVGAAADRAAGGGGTPDVGWTIEGLAEAKRVTEARMRVKPGVEAVLAKGGTRAKKRRPGARCPECNQKGCQGDCRPAPAEEVW